MPKRQDTLLNVLERFTRKTPNAWEKVDATFALARALRAAQRDNDDEISEVGLLLDIIDAAQTELLAVAKHVTIR